MPVMLASEISQGVAMIMGTDEDTAAVAAVTTVGTAFGDKLLAAKADATVTAIAGGNMYFCLIYEHGIGRNQTPSVGG